MSYAKDNDLNLGEAMPVTRLFCALLLVFIGVSVPSWGQTDWPMYNHDPASTRYSPLNQINTQNVQKLTAAWTYHMKKDGPQSHTAGALGHGGSRRSSEATPIVVNGVMYFPTPYGTIVALDPETGKERWSYRLDHGRPAPRAVSYWHGDAEDATITSVWRFRRTVDVV